MLQSSVQNQPLGYGNTFSLVDGTILFEELSTFICKVKSECGSSMLRECGLG